MTDDLQGDEAEYNKQVMQCGSCGQDRGAGFFLLDDQAYCAACQPLVELAWSKPISKLEYGRAVGAGSAVAVTGAVVWGLVREHSGLELSVLGIAIGWGIARAIRWGAGRGGRVLQIVGIALTYLAIVESSLPAFAARVDPEGGVIATVGGAGMALALPYFMLQGGVASTLWFIIVLFALNACWRRLSHQTLVWTGPLG